MPTYEYKCTKCHQGFEVMQKMSDKPLAKCQACGGKLKRLIGSGAGIIFKGSGFYCTDYKKSSVTPAAKSEAAPAAKSESTPAAEPKSSPAPKSDAAASGKSS